jgi:hypothetical protein
MELMQTTRVIRSFGTGRMVGPFSALMLAAAVQLNAIPITSLSPTDLDPGARLITFAGLPAVSQPTSVGGVGFVLANGAGPDVAFDPNPVRQFGPAEGTFIQNLMSGFLDLNMNFPSPIYQLGFDMRTWPGQVVNLTFSSHGNTLQSLSLPTLTTTSTPTSPLLFYGFQSTVPFDHVLLDISGPSSSFFMIDNVAFTPVPDAAATWPLLAGAVGLVWLARRKWREA